MNQNLVLTLFESKTSGRQYTFVFGTPLSWNTMDGASAPYNSRLGQSCPVVIKRLMKTHRVRVVINPENVRYRKNQIFL